MRGGRGLSKSFCEWGWPGGKRWAGDMREGRMASEEAAAHGSSSTTHMIMSGMLPSRRVLVPHRSPFSAGRRHLFTTRTSNQVLDPWISKLVPRWARGARGSSELWNFPPKGRSQCQGAAGSDRILRGHGIPTLADGDQARAVIPGDLHVSSTGHQNLLWRDPGCQIALLRLGHWHPRRNRCRQAMESALSLQLYAGSATLLM